MRRSSAAIVLGVGLGVGCAPEAGPELGEVDALARVAPLALSVESVPVDRPANVYLSGDRVALTATGAAPRERVRFWASFGAADVGPCPAVLGGACLSLGGQTWFAGVAVADDEGVAVVELGLPALERAARLSFQAAVRRGPGGSASVVSPTVEGVSLAPAWEGSIVLDGDLRDWTVAERFGTTSADGSEIGVTWDRDFLYVSFVHPDLVGPVGAATWSAVAIGSGGPGSADVPGVGVQAPTLPFAADLVIRRRDDGTDEGVSRWDDLAGAWVSTRDIVSEPGFDRREGGGGLGGPPAALELRIPRSELGGPEITVSAYKVDDTPGAEGTYAGAPADAFLDGAFDPDPATAFVFDLDATASPVEQNP